MLHRFHCISLCHIVVLYRGSPDPLFHWCNFFMSDSRIWGSLAFRFGRFRLNPLTEAFSALLFKLTQFLCHKSVRNIGLLFVITPFFQVRNACTKTRLSAGAAPRTSLEELSALCHTPLPIPLSSRRLRLDLRDYIALLHIWSGSPPAFRKSWFRTDNGGYTPGPQTVFA